MRDARRHALVLQDDALISSFRKGEIGSDAFDKLVADVDARLVRLEIRAPT